MPISRSDMTQSVVGPEALGRVIVMVRVNVGLVALVQGVLGYKNH